MICKPLSLDDDGDSAVLSINAASVALHLSELNFQGPVAAVRVARLGNEVVVFSGLFRVYINSRNRGCSCQFSGKSCANLITFLAKMKLAEKLTYL